MMEEEKPGCPFKLTLVGVTFYCKGILGHLDRCHDDPPGVDARITWKPSSSDLMDVIQKCIPKEARGV